MAMGNNGGDGSKLYFLSVRGLKKGEKVFIKVVEPVEGKDGEYKELPDISQVRGMVQKLEVINKTFEGESYDEIRLWLKDVNAGELGETYCLSCGVNSMGRNIINNLASIEDATLGELFINVYMRKGTEFSAVYMEHNGEKLSWSLDKDALAPFVKSTTKKVKGSDGKTTSVKVNDYFDLNEHLLGILREQIIPKVKPASVERSAPATSATSPDQGIPAGDDDDLPF